MTDQRSDGNQGIKSHYRTVANCVLTPRDRCNRQFSSILLKRTKRVPTANFTLFIYWLKEIYRQYTMLCIFQHGVLNVNYCYQTKGTRTKLSSCYCNKNPFIDKQQTYQNVIKSFHTVLTSYKVRLDILRLWPFPNKHKQICDSRRIRSFMPK